jgi:two-component system OmpR family sensor kinase
MLDAQRLDGGRLQINRTPVDLNQILRDVARQQSTVAKEHTIVLSLDDAVPLVDGDTDRLTQVVTNLIANAVKYATPGAIKASTALESGQVHLQVSDEGPGIPAESVERIFERYYRVATADVGLITGTGLGLPIVRGLVELHEGRVWCESSSDSGSVFHVVLPVTTSQEVA